MTNLADLLAKISVSEKSETLAPRQSRKFDDLDKHADTLLSQIETASTTRATNLMSWTPR